MKFLIQQFVTRWVPFTGLSRLIFSSYQKDFNYAGKHDNYGQSHDENLIAIFPETQPLPLVPAETRLVSKFMV